MKLMMALTAELYNNLFWGNGSFGLFAYGDTIINNVIYG